MPPVAAWPHGAQVDITEEDAQGGDGLMTPVLPPKRTAAEAGLIDETPVEPTLTDEERVMQQRLLRSPTPQPTTPPPTLTLELIEQMMMRVMDVKMEPCVRKMVADVTTQFTDRVAQVEKTVDQYQQQAVAGLASVRADMQTLRAELASIKASSAPSSASIGSSAPVSSVSSVASTVQDACKGWTPPSKRPTTINYTERGDPTMLEMKGCPLNTNSSALE